MLIWVNSALLPSQVTKSSTGIGSGKGGNVTSVTQVTLCDPIWHASSRSGEAGCELPYAPLHFEQVSKSIYTVPFKVAFSKALWRIGLHKQKRLQFTNELSTHMSSVRKCFGKPFQTVGASIRKLRGSAPTYLADDCLAISAIVGKRHLRSLSLIHI